MSYLRRSLKNLIVDKLRALDRRPLAVSLDDGRADDTLSPLDWVLNEEQVELYEEALQCLKPRDAVIVTLRLEQQLSHHEIAVQIGFATDNAARVAVRRALYRLAHEMGRLSRTAGRRRGDGT